MNNFLKLSLAYLIGHCITPVQWEHNIVHRVSQQRTWKYGWNMIWNGMFTEPNFNFYRTAFAQHRTKPNATALVYVRKAQVRSNSWTKCYWLLEMLSLPERSSSNRLVEATFCSPFKNQLTSFQEVLDTAASFLSFSAFIWLPVLLLFTGSATDVTY